MDAGCHVFVEKPLATMVADAEAVVAKAQATGRKLVVGYILRVHPAWPKLVEIGRGARQAVGDADEPEPAVQRPGLGLHKSLMRDADADRRLRRALCRRDVPAHRRAAGPRARHRRPALGGDQAVQNYGHLHVAFDDGSVGWYEAGWGPMMSRGGLLREGRWGPKGSISIVVRQDGAGEASADQVSASADIDQHTRTNALKLHHAELDAAGNFAAGRRVARHVRRARPPGLVRA